MAKKRPKAQGVSIEGFETRHYKTTEQYAALVERLFNDATAAIANQAAKTDIDTSKPFSFDDYPALKKTVHKEIDKLAENMTTVITKGSRKQWLFANTKDDAFLDSILDTTKLTKAQLKKLQDRNLDGLQAFQERKVNGMNLSQRVWNYIDQYRKQIEQCIDVGLGDGRSAAQLARDVKQYLVYPDKLFRRVRDKNGNLVLSKAAAAFHPGQGVYRSSVKNAQRLTRSEINMAYREADWQRWQTMDFVIGIEVKRSNHRPEYKCKLCDRLAGRYPKTFKFVGWHPQCRCYVVPILADYYSKESSDARVERMRAALNGTEYKKQQRSDLVTDMPQGFLDWCKENEKASETWKSTPYFIRDNFTDGRIAKGLRKGVVPEKVTPANTQPLWSQLDADRKGQIVDELIKLTGWNGDVLDALRYYGIKYDTKDKMLDDIRADREHKWWMIDQVRAEHDRIMAELNTTISDMRNKVKDALFKYRAAVVDAEPWIDITGLKAKFNNTNADFKTENAKKYGRYKALDYSVTSGTMQVASVTGAVDAMKQTYKDTVAKLKAAYDTMKDDQKKRVDAILAKQPSVATPAFKLVNEMNNELSKGGDNGNMGELIKDLDESYKVDFKPAEKYKEQPTDDEIIKRLGGGDMTSGSCSSLAFAFAANKLGFDVLDFRDGQSREFFSRTTMIAKIAHIVGGIDDYNMSGIEAMRKTEVGKLYYIATGRHAAVVRTVMNGKKKEYQYLELQSSYDNGWHHLDAKKFAWRFSSKGREWTQLIDFDLLKNEPGFRKLMGYINTNESEQHKSVKGTIK